MKSNSVKGKVVDQAQGVFVHSINQQRLESELRAIGIQNQHFVEAVREIDKVRDFVGSPENILGNPKTKHGEIAEQVEVGISRARQILHGQEPTSTFEGIGRTAPADYLKDGIEVQSKFINGANNNLEAVIGHMEKYSSFGRESSYYQIPKDYYRKISEIISDSYEDGDLSQKSISAIQQKVARIEELSGKGFEEVVKPGISTYPEVQQGKIHQTLDAHGQTLKDDEISIKDAIRKDHAPNIIEAGQVAIGAAAIGAGITLTTSLYQKYKDGKKFYAGDFSIEDWKEVGVDSIKGGAVGGVSGIALYGLTNYASLSAPFAASVVSVTKGMGSLLKAHKKGEIDSDEFVELGLILCSESAIVGAATLIGQTVIPIPVLGALIGSTAGAMFVNSMGAGHSPTKKKIRAEIESYLSSLDEEYKLLISEINNKYQSLNELIDAAFDTSNNVRIFEYSIELAVTLGVSDEKILRSTNDVDKYMTE